MLILLANLMDSILNGFIYFNTKLMFRINFQICRLEKNDATCHLNLQTRHTFNQKLVEEHT